jgi:hypothetical protein
MLRTIRRDHTGNQVIVLGLTAQNVAALLMSKTITFDGRPLGVDAEVMILAADTEQDVTLMLNKLLPPAAEGV